MLVGFAFLGPIGCSPIPPEAQLGETLLDLDKTAPLTGPAVDLIYGSFSQKEITIIYSEPVNDSAIMTENYQILNLTVESIRRINSRSVRLTTSEQMPLMAYPIRIMNIQNVEPNALTLISDSVYPYQSFPKPRFETDFSYMPPRTHLINHAHLESGVLKLTLNENSQNGTFIMDSFDPGTTVLGFVVSFKARVGGGAAADGFSLSFGADVPYAGIAEEGAGTGIIFSFDTWQNAENLETDRNMVEVKFNQARVMEKQVNAIRTGTNFVEVLIYVHPGGMLDLVWDGVPIYRGLMAYTFPQAGLFAFGARTGGANDNHWIDDLQIATFLPPVVDTVPPTLLTACSDKTFTNVVATFSEPVNEGAENGANYSIPGLTIDRVIRLNTHSVLLQTSAQEAGKEYTLSVQNIQDRATPANGIASNPQKFTAPDLSVKYFADFCSLPPDAKIYGTARVQDGVLMLTDTNLWKVGTLVLPRLDGAKTLESFQVDFKARLSPGPEPYNPGHGLTFSYGTFPNMRFGSEGAGNGLIVHFSLANQLVEVRFGGDTIQSVSTDALNTGTSLVDGRIRVDSDGTLDVIWNGKTIVSNLLAYLQPVAGRFAFSANSDGNNSADHWIDTLRINTTPVPPDLIRPVLLSARALVGRPEVIDLLFSEPIRAGDAGAITNYLLTPQMAIAGAELDETGTRVRLSLAEALQPGTAYKLTVGNLRDRANTPNDVGLNMLDPNPTTITFHLSLTGPGELGQRVQGYQDDFSGSQRNPLWIPHGPGGDVYQQSEGMLKVSTAEGAPNHLLYNAQGYHDKVQEIVARVRVKNMAPDNVARGGIGAAIPLSSGIGVNLALKNDEIHGLGKHATIVHDEGGASAILNDRWETDDWFWIRLKQTNLVAMAKFWPADGVEDEPLDWTVLNHNQTTGGLAGITASVAGSTGEFEVDYILIKAEGLPEIVVDPEACRVNVDLPVLTLSREGAELVISWPMEGTLLEADQVAGPYSPVQGLPASPYRLTPGGAAKFYLLEIR